MPKQNDEDTILLRLATLAKRHTLFIKDNTFEVLLLSISNHYSIIIKSAKEILVYIDSLNDNSELSDTLNSWNGKLNYSPNVLMYKEAIAETLYKYEKYYLDK